MLTRGLLALIPAAGTARCSSRAQPGPAHSGIHARASRSLTGIIFGLLPGAPRQPPDPWTTLKDTVGSIAGTGGSLFLRKGLVTAQVALSFLLLFGAGLFVRSLQNLKSTETGVALDNLVTFQLSPALSGYDDARAVSFYQQLLDRLRGAPDVKSAALAARADPERRRVGQHDVGRRPHGAGRRRHAGVHERPVARLLRDDADPASRRARFPADDVDARRRTVASSTAISRSTSSRARARSASTSAGAAGPKSKLDIEIIGVVADSLYEGPREGVRRQVFIPNWGKNSATFYVRTADALRRARTTSFAVK